MILLDTSVYNRLGTKHVMYRFRPRSFFLTALRVHTIAAIIEKRDEKSYNVK